MNGALHTSSAGLWPDLELTPGPVLRAFGLRRSGNHAVINWLLRNAPDGRSIFFNNCNAGRNPFKTHNGMEVNGKRRAVKHGMADVRANAALAGDGATLLISYEDVLPNVSKRSRAISEGIDESLIDIELIIYRGFLNWTASILKKLQKNDGYTTIQRVNIVLRAVELYSRSLDLVVNQTSLGLIAICYDDWLDSASYRGALLNRFGFPLQDDSLGEVQHYGGGSSFQGKAGSAEGLETKDRWRQMASDQEYQVILWLAAKDAGFVEKLGWVFPDDETRLLDIAENSVIKTSLQKEFLDE